MLLAALLALQIVRQPPPPDRSPSALPVSAAEMPFVNRWRREWMSAEDDRRPAGLNVTYESTRNGAIRAMMSSGPWHERALAVHCHPDWLIPATANRIASAYGGHGQCPAWYRRVGESMPDETFAVDSALAPSQRRAIAAERWKLIASLDTLARVMPTDALLAGQRVRFLVDALAYDSALAVARDCGAGTAVCARLAGYVFARRGDVWPADSAFAAAREAMSDAERCAWDDVRALLDDEGRKVYARVGCDERASVNARLWWVARPLLTEPANERRVEHYMRKVYVELHSALGYDERHDWRPGHAGDALATMYERYGVPSYLYWGNADQDDGHDGYLTRTLHTPPSPPYTAAEYRTPRMHLVPAWSAVRDPTGAQPDDWELTAKNPDEPGTWWPREHYLRAAGLLLPMHDAQTALLRRAQGGLLALATVVPKAARAREGAREATLVVSWHPDSLMQVGTATPDADGRLVVTGSAGTRAALVGVELPSTEHAPGARLRLGMSAPPPPLVTMRPREVAVSEPLLFDAPTTGPVPNDPDGAIARMLATTHLKTRRVGVYWESYGPAPSDTVDVEIRVERADSAGAVRRMASALKLADRREGGLSVRWREPRADRVVHVVEAPRPVVARSVVLELSQLPGGRYWLEVSVARAGAEAARARRLITLE